MWAFWNCVVIQSNACCSGVAGQKQLQPAVATGQLGSVGSCLCRHGASNTHKHTLAWFSQVRELWVVVLKKDKPEERSHPRWMRALSLAPGESCLRCCLGCTMLLKANDPCTHGPCEKHHSTVAPVSGKQCCCTVFRKGTFLFFISVLAQRWSVNSRLAR